MDTRRTNKFISSFMVAALWLPIMAVPAFADVERKDFIQLAGDTQKKPIYEWRDQTISPKAVVVAIHGVTLHGGVFDTLGRYLASEGYIVLAPDLIGHGRRYYDKSCNGFDPVADYVKAQDDLLGTLKEIRTTYAGLKVFWLGESLGANYAVRLAATHPDLVDGIILSSATIRRHHQAPVKLVSDVCVNTVVRPSKQVSLKTYTSRYLSDDPQTIKWYEGDPLMRKSLSPHELLTCVKVIGDTLPYAKDISKTPVLVIQGTDDKMVQAVKAEDLMSRMKSNDRTLHWAERRGHLLFMTSNVQPDLEVLVDHWLNARLPRPETYTTASDTATPPRNAVPD